MKKGWNLEESFGNDSSHNFEWNKIPVLMYKLSQHWSRLSLLSLASEVPFKFKPNSLPNLNWDFENLRTSQRVFMANYLLDVFISTASSPWSRVFCWASIWEPSTSWTSSRGGPENRSEWRESRRISKGRPKWKETCIEAIHLIMYFTCHLFYIGVIIRTTAAMVGFEFEP